MLLPVLLLILAQDFSHRGPTIRIQQDLLKLCETFNMDCGVSLKTRKTWKLSLSCFIKNTCKLA